MFRPLSATDTGEYIGNSSADGCIPWLSCVFKKGVELSVGLRLGLADKRSRGFLNVVIGELDVRHIGGGSFGHMAVGAAF